MTHSTLSEDLKAKIIQCVTEPALFNESLLSWTTIHIGGPAEMMVFPKSRDEFEKLIATLRECKIPYIILGAGSNILVRDGGIQGVVISMNKALATIEVKKTEGDRVSMEVGSGVMISKFLDYCAFEGFSGLECLWGIPGSIGGGLFMNAGTREGEIGDFVCQLNIISREGKYRELFKDEIEYHYRSIKLPRGTVILSALLELKKTDPEEVRRKQKKFIDHRVETQPLKWPNLGSIFKNPPKKYAGQLIEEAGLKDIRVGGARVSPMHGNFIINEGGATAKDVLTLVGLIKDKVKEKYQINLETEIKVLGE